MTLPYVETAESCRLGLTGDRLLISKAIMLGRIAHQEVPHVHFHIIPKPSESDDQGLVIGWPTQKVDKEELKKLHEELLTKL